MDAQIGDGHVAGSMRSAGSAFFKPYEEVSPQ